MNKRKSQSGSIHLLIAIILLVVILATLGFIFWQNFIEPKTNKSAESTASTELTEVASDQTINTGLTVKYPKTWKLSHKAISNEFDTSTITSPDGRISVILNSIITTGLGTDCNSDTTMQVIDKDAIPNLPSLGFIAYITHSNLSHSYGYRVGAYFIQDLKDCNTYYGSEFIYGEMPKLSTLYIEFNDINNNVDANSLMPSDIYNAMSTNNYKIAKQIVQSLYKR
jgi:hypothetical protein